jgi:hypothetical protein
MAKRIAGVVALIVVSFGCVTSVTPNGSTGTIPGYEGTVRTEWLSDGRRMQLLEDFTFIDAAGRRWKAPKGATVDGASIPRALWWSGGPYEGQYRDASVVHDVYCDENPKTATWRAVHRMFYDAMVKSGVETARALVMYGAVYRHGPRWPDPAPRDAPAVAPPPKTATPLEEDVKRVEMLVNEGKVTTPEEIEKLPLVITP